MTDEADNGEDLDPDETDEPDDPTPEVRGVYQRLTQATNVNSAFTALQQILSDVALQSTNLNTQWMTSLPRIQEESARRASLAVQIYDAPRINFASLMPGLELMRSQAMAQAVDLSMRWAELTRSLARYLPSNWRGARGLDHPAMLRVMEDGIPLVWVPSAPIILELTAEPDKAARRQILEQQAPTVIADCRATLAEVTRTDLASLVDYLLTCLDLVETSHPAPAQALAASVWDTTLRAIVRANPTSGTFKGYRELKSQLPKATEETELIQFRAYCLNTSTHAALATFHEPTPVPAGYNRHASAHAVGSIQYTLANALAAVMLAVSLLRELEETQLPIKEAE